MIFYAQRRGPASRPRSTRATHYSQHYTPVTDPHLLPRMTTHVVDPNGAMDPRTLKELQDAFVRYGTQQQQVDLGRVIDGSYAEQAVQCLGQMAP
ncbi:MAG TPA: hypothetical protein VII06_06960 [Chloroflexota bacterium]